MEAGLNIWSNTSPFFVFCGHTSKQISQDGSAGLVVLPAAGQPPGGAAHEQRGRAGPLPAQRPAGQMLLPSPVPAVHEQAALPEGLREGCAQHAWRAHRSLCSNNSALQHRL